MSCKYDRDLFFFAVQGRQTVQTSSAWIIFLTEDSHELVTIKILEFYPAHFDCLVTDGLNAEL